MRRKLIIAASVLAVAGTVLGDPRDTLDRRSNKQSQKHAVELDPRPFYLVEGMDANNPSADTPEGYLGGTASWRTDLYTGRASVVTFNESIAMNQAEGVKHTPYATMDRMAFLQMLKKRGVRIIAPSMIEV